MWYFSILWTLTLKDLKSKSSKTPIKEKIVKKKEKKKEERIKIQEILPSLTYDHNVVLYSHVIGDFFFFFWE